MQSLVVDSVENGNTTSQQDQNDDIILTSLVQGQEVLEIPSLESPNSNLLAPASQPVEDNEGATSPPPSHTRDPSPAQSVPEVVPADANISENSSTSPVTKQIDQSVPGLSHTGAALVVQEDPENPFVVQGDASPPNPFVVQQEASPAPATPSEDMNFQLGTKCSCPEAFLILICLRRIKRESLQPPTR